MIAGHRQAAVIWPLGLTQIIGYGTLYYGFSVLVPAMSKEFGWSEAWIFGVFSIALLAGGVVAPTAGRLADRHGAGRLMAIGSVFATAALFAAALSSGRLSFVLALVAIEIAGSLVLYSTAFAAIVQIIGRDAKRSITHLTLIAGFASTLFWPLTAALHEHLSWREVYLVFAGLNLLICLPIHLRLARLPAMIGDAEADTQERQPTSISGGARFGLFVAMLAGFAIEGFVLSSILVHMVPLVQALGMGAAGIFVTTLFGPAQVLSRFINMLFGRGLAQTWLATIAAGLLLLGLVTLLLTRPSIAGGLIFAVLFGLGSGLTSIVGGTLPLELFGRQGYGARLGWVSAARQLSSSAAPFGLSLMMAAAGLPAALWSLAAVGLLGLAAFTTIALVSRQQRSTQLAADRQPAPASG